MPLAVNGGTYFQHYLTLTVSIILWLNSIEMRFLSMTLLFMTLSILKLFGQKKSPHNPQIYSILLKFPSGKHITL